jgi:hypothetical protein
MIWAVLAILGVSAWIIAVLLFVLVRARSQFRSIPESVPVQGEMHVRMCAAP